MKKNRIRLTESQLHRVIKESMNSILNPVDSYKLQIGKLLEELGGIIDACENNTYNAEDSQLIDKLSEASRILYDVYNNWERY